MGALYLKPLNDVVVETDLFYAKFMDDWLIIAPNRWKLIKAVHPVNQTLNTLMVEKHPGKTYIGRASKGFDFLDYHLSPGGLTVASGIIHHHIERIGLLYEQGASTCRTPEYIRRWRAWAASNLDCNKQNLRSSTADYDEHPFLDDVHRATLHSGSLLNGHWAFQPGA